MGHVYQPHLLVLLAETSLRQSLGFLDDTGMPTNPKISGALILENEKMLMKLRKSLSQLVSRSRILAAFMIELNSLREEHVQGDD